MLVRITEKFVKNKALPRVNLAWSVAGNGAYAACQWAILVVLAKLGSAESVGQFAFALALTAPLFLLSGCGLRAALVSDARNETPFSLFLGLRLPATALAFCALVVYLRWSGFSRELGSVVFGVGIMKALEAVSDLYHGLMQKCEQLRLLCGSLVLDGLLSLSLFWIGLGFGEQLHDAILGLIFAGALMLLLYDIPMNARQLPANSLMPQWKLKPLVNLLRLTAPLGLANMLGSLNFNIPGYFLQAWRGETELGYFAALSSLMMVGHVIMNAFGQASAPRLARLYANGDLGAFRRLIRGMVFFALVGTLLGLLIVTVNGEVLLGYVFRPEYISHIDLLVWLLAAHGLGFTATPLHYGIGAARLFRAQTWLSVCGLVTITLACQTLIPAYGVVGAAQALAMFYLTQLLGSVFALQHACQRLRLV